MRSGRLDSFHEPGGFVLGVDAFEDYALDLQERFDRVSPYSEMVAVRKVSVHAALAESDPKLHRACAEVLVKANGTGGSGGMRAGDDGWCIDLGLMAAYTYQMCTRSDWFDDYARMDRHSDASNHVCRITRQRVGLSSSSLPLPPSPHGYAVSTKTEPASRYWVPIWRIDRLLERYGIGVGTGGQAQVGGGGDTLPDDTERSPDDLTASVRGGDGRGPASQELADSNTPSGREVIDFLKVDYDTPFLGVHGAARGGLSSLIARRVFAVMVVEVDHRLDVPLSKTIEALSCLAHRYQYALMLKVPCAGGGGPWVDNVDPRSGLHSRFHPLSTRAAYMPLSGRYHQLVNATFGVRRRSVGSVKHLACSEGGEHCGIQDLLLVDMRRRELRQLIALGNAECGTDFPSDVAELWDDDGDEKASGGAGGKSGHALLAHSPTRMSMVGESEHLRPQLWQDPRPTAPRRAKRLPDGTYTCRLVNATEPQEQSNVSRPDAFCLV